MICIIDIEVLHVDRSGDSHVSVNVRTANGRLENPISAESLTLNGNTEFESFDSSFDDKYNEIETSEENIDDKNHKSRQLKTNNNIVGKLKQFTLKYETFDSLVFEFAETEEKPSDCKRWWRSCHLTYDFEYQIVGIDNDWNHYANIRKKGELVVNRLPYNTQFKWRGKGIWKWNRWFRKVRNEF